MSIFQIHEIHRNFLSNIFYNFYFEIYKIEHFFIKRFSRNRSLIVCMGNGRKNSPIQTTLNRARFWTKT